MATTKRRIGLAEDAVQREPHNAAALRHLASLLAKAGRHQEARARRSEAESLAVTFSCPAATA
jgi:Flp pilus assembly protein TadD